MSQRQQTQIATAAIITLCIVFFAVIWFADHPAPQQAQARPTSRPPTMGIVQWDTALTEKAGQPPRAPYARCIVQRGDRLSLSERITVQGSRYYRAEILGCTGYIAAEAAGAW